MNILYTETVEKITHFNIVAICLFLIMIFFICLIIVLILDYITVSETIIKIIISIVTIIGIYLSIQISAVKVQENYYYITIDNQTLWNTVNNKYEIIEQKGQLYIVKEKEEAE